jgi:hypothetical protein
MDNPRAANGPFPNHTVGVSLAKFIVGVSGVCGWGPFSSRVTGPAVTALHLLIALLVVDVYHDARHSIL